MKKYSLILIVLLLLAGAELLGGRKDCLAVNFLYNPSINNEQIEAEYPKELIFQLDPGPIQQTAHAPEPATFILFLSGITGFLIRFINRSFEKFKRVSDIMLALMGLIVTSPMLIFAAALIRLNSRGPIVYKQKRVGKDGKIFKIYKLRTMKRHAEKETGAVWARKNDPRITNVGRVLRKTHIDEIPQLYNVLKGEMSIIGPRPERPEMVRDFKRLIVDYEKRLRVKPGITGVAQAWHKYDETIQDVKKKIKYDLLYIKKMCLWLDLRVLAQTLVVVAAGKDREEI